MKKLNVSYTWEVISTNPDRCADCPHSTAMQEINLETAKELASIQNGDYTYKYWLGEGMNEFKLR